MSKVDKKQLERDMRARTIELAAIMDVMVKATEARDWVRLDSLQERFHDKSDEMFLARKALRNAERDGSGSS